MPNYLLTYRGGVTPEGEDAQAKVMAAWNNWLADVGEALIDGGNPVGIAKLIMADGTISDATGAERVTGYSILEADDLDEAIELARACPILMDGGSIELSELIEMNPPAADEEDDEDDDDDDDDDDEHHHDHDHAHAE